MHTLYKKKDVTLQMKRIRYEGRSEDCNLSDGRW